MCKSNGCAKRDEEGVTSSSDFLGPIASEFRVRIHNSGAFGNIQLVPAWTSRIIAVKQDYNFLAVDLGTVNFRDASKRTSKC